MRSKSAIRGLTLIELLVAISMLAFVAILGWRGLDSIVRARIALTSDLEQTRGMQLTFAQLQSDCAHLASTAMLPNQTPLIIDQGRLSLIRSVFADNQPIRQQVITYRINNGMLIRQESAATRDLNELKNLWLAAKNDTGTTQAVALQSGVSTIGMRLWDGRSWRATDVTPPNTAANPAIPTGLEVTLKLHGRDGGMSKIFMLGAI